MESKFNFKAAKASKPSYIYARQPDKERCNSFVFNELQMCKPNAMNALVSYTNLQTHRGSPGRVFYVYIFGRYI